jgi:tetratricopeptide (TPR) repeat protein
MKEMPAYITDIYKGVEKDVSLEKAEHILSFLPAHNEDKDYLYAWAIAAMRYSEDYTLVSEKCRQFLPEIKTLDARLNVQNMLIWALDDLGQHEEAMTVRLQRLAEDNCHGRDYREVAKAYVNLKDYTNAIKYYEIYLEAQEYNVDEDIFVDISQVYSTVGDFKNAAKYYEYAARESARFSPDYWLETGRLTALAGNEEEALFYFKVCLKINPTESWAHYYMGMVYQNKDDLYRALHHYNEALKLEPKMPAVYNNLSALAYNDEGDIKKAIQHIETALTFDCSPELEFLLYRNLRMLYKQICDYEKAEYYLLKMMVGSKVDLDQLLVGDSEEEEDDEEEWDLNL